MRALRAVIATIVSAAVLLTPSAPAAAAETKSYTSDIIAYNAHVHPSLRAGDRWTLSYNVNSMDSRVAEDADHYRDPGIYKPRFVSFRIVPS